MTLPYLLHQQIHPSSCCILSISFSNAISKSSASPCFTDFGKRLVVLHAQVKDLADQHKKVEDASQEKENSDR